MGYQLRHIDIYRIRTVYYNNDFDQLADPAARQPGSPVAQKPDHPIPQAQTNRSNLEGLHVRYIIAYCG